MFFPTVACLIGILVGLHYSVLALVPATLAVVFAAGVGAMVSGEAASAVLMGVITLAILLQAGYVIGLMARAQFGLLFSRIVALPSKRVQTL
jgi:TRAP-type mannitol/chloroaromatic compound transport system permease large subunit